MGKIIYKKKMGKIKLLEWMRNENGEANLGMASGNKTELDQRERERDVEKEKQRSKLFESG